VLAPVIEAVRGAFGRPPRTVVTVAESRGTPRRGSFVQPPRTSARVLSDNHGPPGARAPVTCAATEDKASANWM
jgi:hypothetical protein